MRNEEERNTFIFISALVITQVLALVFANNIVISKIPVERYEPFGNENVVQASANSGLLVISVLIFTLFLVGVIKLGLIKIFKLFSIGMPLFFLFFMLQLQTEIISFRIFKLPVSIANFISALVVFYLFFVVYSIFKKIDFVTHTAFILMTALIGAFLAVSFAPPTLFIFPIAFALYDIYAVFRGPLRTLIKIMPLKPLKVKKKVASIDLHKKFGLLLARIGGFTIGAGDFTFYSMLVAAGFVIKGLTAAFAVALAINIGVIATLMILQKYQRPIPGLPIPITLGILTLVLI